MAVIVSFIATHRLLETEIAKTSTKGFVELLEPSLGSMFFIGAAIFLPHSLEGRLERNRALAATHELRVLAHIIDMHQLTKDPERLIVAGAPTESSPERLMSRFELSRYLDYCSEMLSINSKIVALYSQSFTDPTSLSAVDQVEILTAGLSRKIWQKPLIHDRLVADDEDLVRRAELEG